jgi:hypothetical protein
MERKERKEQKISVYQLHNKTNIKHRKITCRFELDIRNGTAGKWGGLSNFDVGSIMVKIRLATVFRRQVVHPWGLAIHSHSSSSSIRV